MGRRPCCDERQDLKKGPWSTDEDRKLVTFISSHGLVCWSEVPKLAGLMRCGKSCRLRWINYLRPDVKRGMLSPHEENLVIHLHACYGNKLQEELLGSPAQSVISPQLPTSLSHTPTTNCEDEQSMDYSADSVCCDRSFDSNVPASIHEFASEEMFQVGPHMIFACQSSGQEGLLNTPCMLSTCQASIGQKLHMHNPSPIFQDAPLLHNPALTLQNGHPHMPQNASSVTPHMRLRTLYSDQPMQYVLPSLVTSKIEDGGMSTSSSRMNESNNGCNIGGIEVEESVPPYFSPSMLKYLQDQDQASQVYELNHGEATTSTDVSGTQGRHWNNTMLDMFFSAQGEAEIVPRAVESPQSYEESQALGQHYFAAAACNPLNVEQWGNMDS